MFFPSLFFDAMVHLTLHLVDEIKYCGPLFLRNMYPFEWFKGILKHFCRNWNHPEASILQGYTAEVVVEFCTEYMKQRHIGLPLSRNEGRLKGKLVLAGTQMAAPRELAEKAHLTVLLNSPVLIAYAEEHLVEIRQSFLPMVPSSDVEMRSTLRTTPNGWRIVWHKYPSMTLLRGWHKIHHLRCWRTKHMT